MLQNISDDLIFIILSYCHELIDIIRIIDALEYDGKIPYVSIEYKDIKKNTIFLSKCVSIKVVLDRLDNIINLNTIDFDMIRNNIVDMQFYNNTLKYLGVFKNLRSATFYEEYEPLDDNYGLKNICNVEKLILSNTCKITGSAFKWFTNLTELSMNHCRGINETCLKYLTKLLCFEYIASLYGEQIYINLIYLKTLTKLTLYNTTLITDDVIKELANLTYLNLHETCNITGNCLKQLPNLTTLIIWRCESVNYKFIAECKTLKTLKTTIKLCGLLTLPNLTDLTIPGYGIPKKNIGKLKQLRTLRIIKYHWNYHDIAYMYFGYIKETYKNLNVTWYENC
jgi:hypothetical protein